MRRSLPTHGFTALSFCLVTVIMTQIYGFCLSLKKVDS